MSDIVVPEPHCFYCDAQNCDHKHGGGHACGDCCGMHGSVAHQDKAAYEWIRSCLKAKNERIAQAEERVKTLREALILLRAQHILCKIRTAGLVHGSQIDDRCEGCRAADAALKGGE